MKRLTYKDKGMKEATKNSMFFFDKRLKKSSVASLFQSVNRNNCSRNRTLSYCQPPLLLRLKA